MKIAVFFLLPLLATVVQAQRPRIAIGGILHESNTFSAVKTDLAAFEAGSITRGEQIEAHWGKSSHEVGGFIEGARRYGLELYPTLVANATPGGPVTDQALDALTAELIARLKAAPKLDGLLLALHGAMVAESYLQGDAEVMRRLRQALGSELPIVVTHDFHANVGEDIVRLSTALVTYKETPHIDQHATGLRAAEIMSRIARGEVKPVQALAKPPMIYNIVYQYTKREPLLPIVEESRRLEKNPKILAASVSGGYQYGDTPQMGPSVIVVTDNDRALAEREAKRLADMLWATRDKLVLHLPEAAEAVRQAIASVKTPNILVEMGDNIGGGSAGDSTFILAELVKQAASGWVVAIYDPQAVQQAVKAGVGGSFDAPVGGKTDDLHGKPVRIRGQVKLIYDGQYVETAVRHGGSRYLDQGLSAVVHAEGSTPDFPNVVLLNSKRHTPFSLGQLTSCGIEPERQKILVVKAAIAYRAAYEPIAGRIIEVDTGGLTAVNPARFTYKHVRKPLFGLD